METSMPKEMMCMSKEVGMIDPGGHLCVQMNETQNPVIHYRRAANGTLAQLLAFASRSCHLSSYFAKLIAFFGAALFWALSAYAQVTTADVVGTVHDPTGAVIAKRNNLDYQQGYERNADRANRSKRRICRQFATSRNVFCQSGGPQLQNLYCCNSDAGVRGPYSCRCDPANWTKYRKCRGDGRDALAPDRDFYA